jgi:hypothetical protein
LKKSGTVYVRKKNHQCPPRGLNFEVFHNMIVESLPRSFQAMQMHPFLTQQKKKVTDNLTRLVRLGVKRAEARARKSHDRDPEG